MSFKRARPPAPHPDGGGAGLVLPDEPLPFIPPLHASLALLVRGTPQAASAGGGARALLARLAAADCAQAQSPAAAAAAAARLASAYASSRALEAARGEAAARLEAEAALHARRAGEAAALAAGAGSEEALQQQQPLSRDAAASAAEASAVALREYGLHSASARAAAVVQHGSEASGGSGSGSAQLQLPPPALAADPARLYAGRPLRGATSGAAYLAAEREAGAPPPQREAWRYPIDASAASGALDPHLVLGAREMLRRPCWPDRLHPRLLASGGAPHARGLALAAQYDAAAEEGAAIAALEVRALQALARQGGAPAAP